MLAMTRQEKQIFVQDIWNKNKLKKDFLETALALYENSVIDVITKAGLTLER